MGRSARPAERIEVIRFAVEHAEFSFARKDGAAIQSEFIAL
jgi:hypothetical protein